VVGSQVWSKLRVAFIAAGVTTFSLASLTVISSADRRSNIVAASSCVGLALVAETLRGTFVVTNIRGYRVLAPVFAAAALTAFVGIAAGVPGAGATSACCARA
jgi:hypothetical protein